MNYSYISLSNLRNSGISIIQYPDALALKLIKRYGERINRITGKNFIPTNFVRRYDGGKKIIKLHHMPILDIKYIHIVDSNGGRTPLDKSKYELYDNYFVKFYTLITEGISNVEINFVASEIENQKNVTIKLVEDLENGDGEIFLVDTSELEADDVLILNGRCFIANSINYSENSVSIDNNEFATIPSGVEGKSYGRVPILIEDLIVLFINHHKLLQRPTGAKIKSEKIGDYAYTVQGDNTGFTGISEIDSILNLYINDDIEIHYL